MNRIQVTAAWIGVVAAFCALGGWAFMLLIMVLHAWLHDVPTIGYLNAVALVLFARVIGVPFEIRSWAIR